MGTNREAGSTLEPDDLAPNFLRDTRLGTMWRFAWKNLLTRPLRTVLALIGLSIPVVGVLGLYSVSGGLRNLVDDTLSQIQGVVVLRENVPSPVFSDIDPETVEAIREVPGVRVVAPEVWGLAPTIEGSSFMAKAVGSLLKGKEQRLRSMLDAIVISGQDIPTHADLKSAVFAKALLPPEEGGGRFLQESDIGKDVIVISRKIAQDFPNEDKSPKKVGDKLVIGDGEKARPFEIIGIYDSGSMFLDVVIVAPIDVARRVLDKPAQAISSIYVEATDPREMDAVALRIEERIAGVDARSMDEFASNFTRLLGDLDKFLLMIVSLALFVGVVGIVNTMLMSTTERFTEFGVLRTLGWSRSHLLTLVTAESAYLGFCAGIAGCLMAWIGTTVANQFLTGGLKLVLTPRLFALGVILSVVMGVLGGLYPAWRATRMVPMDAIRLGNR